MSTQQGNIQDTGKGKDTYVLIQKPLENFYFFGVFDSHGSSGKEVSESLSNFYQNFIEMNYKVIQNYPEGKFEVVTKFLKDSIQKAENYMKINNIDLKYSGSTVHLIMIIKKEIQDQLFIDNLKNKNILLNLVKIMFLVIKKKDIEFIKMVVLLKDYFQMNNIKVLQEFGIKKLKMDQDYKLQDPQVILLLKKLELQVKLISNGFNQQMMINLQ